MFISRARLTSYSYLFIVHSTVVVRFDLLNDTRFLAVRHCSSMPVYTLSYYYKHVPECPSNLSDILVVFPNIYYWAHTPSHTTAPEVLEIKGTVVDVNKGSTRGASGLRIVLKTCWQNKHYSFNRMDKPGKCANEHLPHSNTTQRTRIPRDLIFFKNYPALYIRLHGILHRCLTHTMVNPRIEVFFAFCSPL